MTINRFLVRFIHSDPRSDQLSAAANALGFTNIKILCQDLYFIDGNLSQDDCRELALQLLIDPLEQSFEFSRIDQPGLENQETADIIRKPAFGNVKECIIVEVVLRPGVTDPVADQIIRAAGEIGINNIKRVSTGLHYQIEGAEQATVEKLVHDLLANDIIQRWSIGLTEPSFSEESISSGLVEPVNLMHASNDELLKISIDRRAALNFTEMKAIQDYFVTVDREPTDVEFEMIAQTWSEHCVHKTFKAMVEITSNSQVDDHSTDPYQQMPPPAKVNSIIGTYLKAATEKINAPWVISAFVDNAGIIDFDEQFEVSFKVETHNHPSAVEPFGGANTGVGGVIRDIIGVSAKPIANTDILCFGFEEMDPGSVPDGVLHPRRIQSGVVAGVQDYGNKIGIPTVNGAILYDQGFTSNPLVFCGCVGIAPKGKHIKSPRPGDRIVIIGGRTGRDGLRGATFSSMTMNAQTGLVSGASVQIGDPITEKGLIDVIVQARDLGLYSDITDCGAGGLSSAVGEMTAEIGGNVDLATVRLKYAGLAPWEIWLSEAQERMVLAIPPIHLGKVRELCEMFDTEMTDIGEFTDERRIVVRYGSKIILDLDNQFLHNGIPQRQLKAVIRNPIPTGSSNRRDLSDRVIMSDVLLQLLSHPNISSKAKIIHLYDHEIQGGTIVKPLTGVFNDGPSDAAVIKPMGTKGTRGIVLSNGINPEYGKLDTYSMAWAVVDEAVRNAVATGADPSRIAILDNFCWGDPLRPETLGSLIEAARGCHDAAIHYGTPYISGKDSLNNEYVGIDGMRHSIPPTLLISAIGIIDDINKSITSDIKGIGNYLYLIGEFLASFGGSHFNLVMEPSQEAIHEAMPAFSETAPKVYKAFHECVGAGLIESAHDLSEGGLAVAAAEMCIGGRLGLKIEPGNGSGDLGRFLFAETNGCILVEIKPEKVTDFENRFDNLPKMRIATVTGDQYFNVKQAGQSQIKLKVDVLVAAWNASL